MLNWLKVVGSAIGRSGATRVSNTAGSSMHEGLESLEQRTLLSVEIGPMPPGAGNNGEAGSRPSITVEWRGITAQVVKNSWVVTFTSRNSKAEAIQKGQQLAAALGVVADDVIPSPLGRFVELRTQGAITDAMVQQAKAQLGFLHDMAPNRLNGLNLVPNDSRYNEQWALNNTGQFAGNSGTGTTGADIEAEPAWNLTTGSKSVIIAVIDTGVDVNHPDLRANIWRNPGEIPNNNVDDDLNGFVDDVNGWDFAAGDGSMTDNNPQDPVAQGHGTAVAGTIGAVGNNGLGVVGVAWNISILPMKIFPEDGLAPQSASNNAIEYVTMLRESGVNIVASNNSWGSVRENSPDQFDDSQRIAIQDHTDSGILFVAAAGNDTLDNDSPQAAYPASYTNPDIIAVAATDNKDGLATFSNYGLTAVDVGAPGVQVLTTENGGGYELIDGTSFASPYTAGVIGLMASLNRFANKTQLKNALYASVDQIPALQGRTVTGGRVNAFKALQAIGVPGPVVAAVSPAPQAATVSEIVVQFSKSIDPSFFSTSKIRLVRANGDNLFNSNDVDVTLNPAGIDLNDNLLTIDLGFVLPQDRYRLILANDGFRDLSGNRLNGSAVAGNDEVYEFNVTTFRGPLEPNDQVDQATPVVLDTGGFARFDDLAIGDGLFLDLDVDMFRVFASSPSLIKVGVEARSLAVPSELDSYVRMFDTNGVELTRNDNSNGLDSSVEYFVPAGGFYYIGVSAYPNTAYLPVTGGTGTPGDTAGSFSVTFSVFTPEPEQRVTTNSTPSAIPDVSVITSTINITDGRSITDINVLVNITHAFISDLRVQLTAPNGGVFTLINRRGGAGDNLNTTFNAEAATAITAGTPPYTGSFRPESDLTALYNTAPTGTWTLTIQDFKATDFGTLNSWSLDLTLSNNLFGPFELNDAINLSTDTGITGAGSRTLNAVIGDGAYGLRDVDLFRFVASSGTTIQAFVSAVGDNVDTIVRIFDSNGVEVAIDKRKGSRSSTTSFIVVNGGTYYVGVSGGNTTNELDFGNIAYNPATGGSGSESDATGDYTLVLSVTGGIGEGSVLLTGNQASVGLNADGTIGLASGDTPTGLSLNSNEFLLLGALESYFGVIADGFIGRNQANAQQSDIALSLVNESDFANRRASATGIFRNLSIKRSLSFGINDRVIAVDVSIRNVGLDTINDIAWVEGFNPNQGLNGEMGDTETFNNVDATGRLATSTANGLTLGLGAADTPFGEFASFEVPGSVRDPYRVINSVSDPNGTEGDQSMALAMNLGTLVPSQTHTFRYFIFMGTNAEVTSDFAALNAGTGVGHLVADPRDSALAAETLPYALYYPEGFANNRANIFIPMINGNDESVRVVIIAHYEGTAAEDVLFDSATESAGGVIGANRRFGYTVSNPTLFAAGTTERVGSQFAGRDGVRKRTPFALEIRSSLPIGATFSNYDFAISTGEAFTSQASTVWTFGDASRSSVDRDFVIFYNPQTTPAKVTLTIYPETGGTLTQTLTSTITVQSERRSGWSLRNFQYLDNTGAVRNLPSGKYSLRLDSDVPIIGAVTHYNTSTSDGFATLGVPSNGVTRGSTGEGQWGTNATDEFITIANTGTVSSTVTLTLNYATGSSLRRTVTAPAQKRTTVNIGQIPGIKAGQPFSISYEATNPVAVNLSSLSFGEETGSALVSQSATQWLFGEGFRPASGSRIRDYLRIFNPASVDTRVAITINYNNGDFETFFQTVKARAANVFNIHDFITGSKRQANAFFSVKVQSAVPITAFFGHFDNNLGGGFGSPGTALGTLGQPS